jgi:hypothetical protein
MNAFQEKGYHVIRNFIPKELCDFAKVYYKIRQDTLEYDIDSQCPGSKSFYADPFCETLLLSGCKKISDEINIPLAPTYSYTRIYGQGDELKIHRDRGECEISATLCLGRPASDEISPIYFSRNETGHDKTELLLDEGDLCVYRGTELYHWRSPFKQTWYLQTFIHYVDMNGPYRNRIFDGRRCLGIKK